MLAAGKKTIQGASSEVVRDINRRIVLHLIRKRHPISRADLARISGLQRSTISLIVEQLVEENWVLEGPTGRLPRGRRPTFLRLNEERVIIGVDVRPIHTTVALADANGRFLSQEIMETPADPKAGIEALIRAIQRVMQASQGKMIEGVGISLPGRFDHAQDRLVFAPNLNWQDLDIRNPIVEATGLDVELENAANACVLAAVWGEHSDSVGDLVVVTVSEGIGTGVLANGQLVRGLNGMAGEFGHVPLDLNGPLCTCGSRGCWEVFASNRAALRYYQESGAPERCTDFVDLLNRADGGDAHAVQAVKTMAEYLGRGMRIIVAGLAPERIMLVGDLTRSWEQFGPVIEAEVQAQSLPGGRAPAILPVHEHGMARLRGTVALILQKHFGIGVEVQG
ncbi:MAG TPA: ROK family transcriptional regulator [Candidatus Acidoferrum sp.]|nr:ROK family transcriptional regulator [Candidatus Acidoferrum sp.]